MAISLRSTDDETSADALRSAKAEVGARHARFGARPSLPATCKLPVSRDQ